MYTSPQPHRRIAIWESISTIKIVYPQLLIGDFNCTLKDGERGMDGKSSTLFASWFHQSCLVDLGFSGPRFTLNHEVNLETRKSARLDRALCNIEWSHSFPEASLRHPTHTYFDHCPILLQTSAENIHVERRPFRFIAT